VPVVLITLVLSLSLSLFMQEVPPDDPGAPADAEVVDVVSDAAPPAVQVVEMPVVDPGNGPPEVLVAPQDDGAAPPDRGVIPPSRVEVPGPGVGVAATINQVIDGMTLDAQVSGMRIPVGYLGVETPSPAQRCGREAIARNRELAGVGQVLLTADPLYQVDERRRQLYYAFTPDGRSIEEVLIGEGLAVAVRTDATRGAALLALQESVQAGGKGCLWAQ
jgi:endonuclease YncB( thermonuclease family)